MKLRSKERIEGKTTKRYDRAQTPYQRILNLDGVSEEQKNRLRERYPRLDPVLMLGELEHLQDQFWAYAYKRPAPPSLGLTVTDAHSSGSALTALDRKEQIPTTIPRTPRVYRRTRKPSVPHTWRTRKDPFVDVWGQVKMQIEIDPSRTVKELFMELQQRYPEKFTRGQLRTLQRRVKQYRLGDLYSRESMQSGWSNLIQPPITQVMPDQDQHTGSAEDRTTVFPG
jgi:hypothetical protein